MKKMQRVAVGAGALVAGMAVGLFAMDSVGAATRPANPSQLPAPHYAKNHLGHTFGSNADATSPANLPDLIKAIATNGQRGFITRADYFGGPLPKNPAEAVAWNQAHKGHSRKVPVYDQEEKTVIGEFVIQN